MVEEGHSRNRTANVLNRMVVLPFVSVFDVPIDSRFRRRMSATGGEANDFLLTLLFSPLSIVYCDVHASGNHPAKPAF